MKCVGGSAVGSDEMFLCVQKHQPRKPLQNSMEKMRPEKLCKHILRKKRGGRPLLCTVLLGRRLGTTGKEMVSSWSGFIFFLGEQNLHIHVVE